jgi:WD40 repeat protein
MHVPSIRTLVRRLLFAAIAAAGLVLAAGSPAYPDTVGLTWSSSGRLLAFWSSSGLYVVNTIQGGVVRLARECVPGSCSPDGLKVAWSTENGTFVYRADTTTTARVAEPGRICGWSPDGAMVLVESSPPRQASEVYAADVDGKGATPLAPHPAADRDPAWSPDGRWIAFVSTREAAGCDIWVVGWDRSNLTRVTSMFEATEPVWSPDGSKLAFAGRVARGAPRQVYSLDFRSRKLAAVTSAAEGDCRAPKFVGPYGLRYVGRQNVIVDMRTGEKHSLPSGDLAPDGVTLALLPGRPASLDLVRLSDGIRRPLDKGVEAEAWSPDGAWIAYLALTTAPGRGLARELRIASRDAKGVYVLWSEGVRDRG